MVGRPVELFYARDEIKQIGDVVFEIKGLRLTEQDDPLDISLRRGEILGLTGMIGSGRSEIIRAIYGLDRRFSGEVWKDGQKIPVEMPYDSINNGIGFISEDRQKSGLCLPLSILVNTTFLKLPTKRSLIDTKTEMEITEQMIGKLDVRTDSMFKVAGMLSGGNQQKVIISKWLHKGFDILILDEPTKGIDVNAKFEIYKLLHQLTSEGKSLIMVSSDMPEVVSLCDRVMVVRKGKIVGEFAGPEITEENVIKAALEVH
jgi:ABC-type sugar transport system ATPase subunit